MTRKIVLLVSLAVGVIAAFLTRLYLAEVSRDLQAEKEAFLRRNGGPVDVLCFNKDTPGGTLLSKSDLGYKTVPANGIRGQAVTKDELLDVLGRKTVLVRNRGDILFWSDIEGSDRSRGGLSADIQRQMRAISINCSGAASVSGLVKPNDRVDVIGTFAFPNENGSLRQGEVVTCTILQNVLVLATGQTTARSRTVNLGTSSLGYSTVTLSVTPREAEMIAFTEQMKGRIVLTLRGRNDTSYERELPKVDFEKIRSEIEELNLNRQQKLNGR